MNKTSIEWTQRGPSDIIGGWDHHKELLEPQRNGSDYPRPSTALNGRPVSSGVADAAAGISMLRLE